MNPTWRTVSARIYSQLLLIQALEGNNPLLLSVRTAESHSIRTPNTAVTEFMLCLRSLPVV